MKKLAAQVREYVKANKMPHVVVKVQGDILVINNLNIFYSACDIASVATGLNFQFMGQSMTKLA